MAAKTSSNPLIRLLNVNTSGEKGGRNLPLWLQLLTQILCLAIAAEVLFPIMYVVTLAFSPISSRPSTLQLIPKFSFEPVQVTMKSVGLDGAERDVSVTVPGSFKAFVEVFIRPTGNKVGFLALLLNSLKLSLGVGFVALFVAVSAAYAFSRFKFKMRQVMMILVFVPLLMPAVGLSTPLYLLMNSIRAFDGGKLIFNLRDSLLGVGIAMTAGALPFAVWNLKGYLDTIPKELEEAAKIDGANANQVFFQIVLPLSLPQLAVTFFLGFMGHWQEFALPWLFLTKPEDYTLSMTMYNMTGQYAQNIPWNRFSAMAIIVALPVAVVYIALQKQIVGGLTAGGVKE